MTEKNDCSTCLYMNEPSSGLHCGKCTHNYVNWYKPMTNGQKVRMMSDRDLAEWIDKNTTACLKWCPYISDANCTRRCTDVFEAWLSSPVENQGMEKRGNKTPDTD